MKKLIAPLLKWYGALCALAITPILLALLLAQCLGMQPFEQIRRAYASLEQPATETPAAAEVRPANAAKPGAAPPADLRTWERRLESMGAGIVSNVQDLTNELERLKAEDQKLHELREKLAELLSATLREPVTSGELVANSKSLIEKLESARAEKEQYPKLLATLQTLNAESLAVILTGNSDSPGLAEEQSVGLLRGFPPRKAGEVLSEIGKLDPALAGRMVARMGGQKSSQAETP